uniref:Uncharacterized protein n=1 Tax=Geladintestivirus 1 TaxID=3233133 RepID=A0AAU8MKW1_9CAUD
MLSILERGNLVHIIDKTKDIKYLIGEIINKTEPTPDYTSNIGGNMQSYFDLTVKVNSETYEFKHINSCLSIVNNGNVILSENKEGLVPAVESILANSKKIIDPDNISYHTKAVEDCEEILKKVNPTFAKEKEMDDRIFSLENKMTGIDSKLDKMFNLLNKNN